MTAHFVMLWEDMLDSTINEHPPEVWKLFTVCLLKADRNGEFRSTMQALSRRANMSMEATEAAMKVLNEDDPLSTSPDEGGKRVVPIGQNLWKVVNYESYRLRAQVERRKAQDRERKRRDAEQGGSVRNDAEESGEERSDSDSYASTSTSTSTSKKKGGSGGKRFNPPTVEEVQAYLDEKEETRIDAEAFVAFYESKGWVVGKSPMKDWKAAVRTWIRQRDSDKAPQRVGAHQNDGEWIYDTFRRQDRDKYGNHSEWERYAEEAAGLEPRSVKPFVEWLNGLEG